MRDSLRPVAIGLLCILALALAAATLTTPVELGDAGFGEGTPDRTADGDRDAGDAEPVDPPLDVEPGEGIALEYCVEPLAEYPIGLLLFLGLFGAAAVLRVRYGTVAAVGLVLVGVWPIVFGSLFLTMGCEGSMPMGEAFAGASDVSPPGSESVGDGGDGDERAVTAPSVAVAAFLVLAILGVLAAMFARNTDEEGGSTEEQAPDSERRTEIGEVAGEAADRIEDEGDDLENEVYRAWAEMTDALEVRRPETSTTTEFADAAIDAGLAREDVQELTRLFEEVRYGTADATPERERRAVDALRSIERQYADDEPTGGGDVLDGDAVDDPSEGGGGIDNYSDEDDPDDEDDQGDPTADSADDHERDGDGLDGPEGSDDA